MIREWSKKRNNKPIHVLRLPPRKVLRSLHFGLTCGLLFCVTLLFWNSVQFAGYSFLLKVILSLILLGLSTLGGTSLLIVLILYIGLVVTGNTASRILIHYYGAGFVFGALVAQLYNFFVYLLFYVRHEYEISFIFDPSRTMNIIKSPIKSEWHDILKKNKEIYHYNYEPEPCPKHPYTIVFIANAWLYDSEGKNAEQDPMINDRDLFLTSVDKALFSFENDDVLGSPEIWSRVRIITIFDIELGIEAHKDKALLQAYPYLIRMGDDIQDNNILVPRDNMWDIMNDASDVIIAHADLPEAEQERFAEQYKTILNEADVVFAMSASKTYIRSTAKISDYKDQALRINNRRGVEFSFQPQASAETQEEINSNPDRIIRARHEEYAEIPGRVALNVLSATLKTYIHEFAHAMSSAVNGEIVDEYFDTVDFVNKDDNKPETRQTHIDDAIPFYVNRLERPLNLKKLEPIPRRFALYNNHPYNSDIDHPSCEENWRGYFPERKACSTGCIMDRTYGSYKFDDLLSQFMYDRLMAKVNRGRR